MNWREYLSFTRKERNGIIALTGILIIVVIAPALTHDNNRTFSPEERKNIMAALDRSSPNKHNYSESSIDSTHYPEVYPRNKNPDQRNDAKYFRINTGKHSSAKKRVEVVEINAADTAQFVALPFIGSKLAARIVLFREKLGGYVHIGQLSEVYGLQDSVVKMLAPRLRCNVKLVKKIPVNAADVETLKQHPYIRWEMAKSLVNFRNQHGPFKQISDLGRIDNIDELAIRKLEPYLDFR